MTTATCPVCGLTGIPVADGRLVAHAWHRGRHVDGPDDVDGTPTPGHWDGGCPNRQLSTASCPTCGLAGIPVAGGLLAAHDFGGSRLVGACHNRKPRGLFIVFEGIDGAGKSTQAQLLASHLGAVFTREPTEHYESTSTDPAVAALEFALDRRRHQREINAWLEAGQPVVCDRYSLSMQAYQHASRCDLDWLIALDAGCRVPDLTIYLDVYVDQAMARLDGRYGENHERARLAKVELAYQKAVSRAQARGERVMVIDGRRPLEKVHAAVKAAVELVGVR